MDKFLIPKHLKNKLLDLVDKFLSPKNLQNKLLDPVDKFSAPSTSRTSSWTRFTSSWMR